MEIKISSMIGGQPKREPKKLSEISERYYHLGRRAAALEAQDKENNQNFQVNNTQQLMINQASMQLMNVLNEVTTRQKMLDMQMQQMSAPPPLPNEQPAGMPPPLPTGQDMGGQLPPEAIQGQPPDMGQGGPPPPDMGQQMSPDMGQPPMGMPPEQAGIPADQIPMG